TVIEFTLSFSPLGHAKGIFYGLGLEGFGTIKYIINVKFTFKKYFLSLRSKHQKYMPFPDNFTPELIIESPGRINLIGEHTDYNLGYVLPTAIEKKITFKLKRNRSRKECRLFSLGYNTGFTLQLDKIARSEVEWENYILGVLNEILLRTDRLRGFDCTIDSKLPMGSGLSSSAALECGLAF